jgi:transposase
MKPKVVELDVEQLEAHLDQIEQKLGRDVARPFRMLLGWHITLLRMIQNKKLTMGRLRRWLLGSRETRSRDDASHPTNESAEEGEPSDHECNEQQDGSRSGSETNRGRGRRRRRPPEHGHGRIAASAYTGCEQIVVHHESLQSGDPCPHCQEGTLYLLYGGAEVVRLKGQPPVGGTRYELERFRCGLCGKVQTAELPKDAGAAKYDATVASIIATLRYGQGLPWKRIERMQGAAGIPLPASVQWEVVRNAIGSGIELAYEQLLWESAQGTLVHNDDTSMRVLELTTKLKNHQPLREDDPNRYGVFTTSILSMRRGRPAIALFFTGPRHSGENLRDLLAKRLADLPPPIQMCDALSRNMPPDLQTIVANCLSHGRRHFSDLLERFPAEVEHVLEALKQVYETDAEAKKQGLSLQDRLHLHQGQSAPVMSDLHDWLQRQFDDRLVEPNSSLGQAISYMLKHWEKLTRFLRVAGAPLDNNICERSLKMAIRHRKNSLFYKTLYGAYVGDLYMSLIHTCYFSKADPYDYLTQLQRNAERVAAAPADWLPWTYQQQLKPEGETSAA